MDDGPRDGWFFPAAKKTVEGKVVYISTIIFDGVSKTSKRCITLCTFFVLGNIVRIRCFPKVYFKENPELLSFFSSGARGQRASCSGDGLAQGMLGNLGSEAVSRAGYWSAEEGGWFLQWELEDGEGKKGIICLEVSTWGLCIVYCSADYMILS